MLLARVTAAYVMLCLLYFDNAQAQAQHGNLQPKILHTQVAQVEIPQRTYVEFDVEKEKEVDAVNVLVRPQRHLELEAEAVQLAVAVVVTLGALRKK